MQKGFSKREKTIFILTLLIIGLSLIYLFLIEPLLKNWQRLKNEIMESKITLGKSLRYLEQKDSLNREYKALIGFAEQKGSDEEEMIQILAEVEKLAQQNFVNLINVKPTSTQNVDFYKKFFIELEVEGAIKDIGKFIYSLQESPLLLRTEKINLTAKEPQSKELKAAMLLTRITLPK